MRNARVPYSQLLISAAQSTKVLRLLPLMIFGVNALLSHITHAALLLYQERNLETTIVKTLSSEQLHLTAVCKKSIATVRFTNADKNSHCVTTQYGGSCTSAAAACN